MISLRKRFALSASFPSEPEGQPKQRACSIVDAYRKMIRYRSRRAPDTELRTQLRDLANARRRFGYRLTRSGATGHVLLLFSQLQQEIAARVGLSRPQATNTSVAASVSAVLSCGAS